MDNYIITWFYAENKEDESYYPSVGKKTSSFEFQKVYWRCVYDFYVSAFLTQDKNVKYLFFTNLHKLPPDVDGVDMGAFFKENNVDVIRTELTGKTPADWFFQFRNQFYVYDIIEKLKSIPGNHLILDSDCLFTKDISDLFSEIEKDGAVAYPVRHAADYPINGISHNGMRRLYKEFYGSEMLELEYLGGELISFRSDIAADIMREYRTLWSLNYKLYEENKEKLNEEAHFWSFIYYKLGFRKLTGVNYTRRIWTAAQLDDMTARDAELSIMHLPAEKRYAFKTMFKKFVRREIADDAALRRVIRKVLLVDAPRQRHMRRLALRALDRITGRG